MKNISLMLSLLFSFILSFQQNTPNESVLFGFEAYTQLPRKAVFVPLNKSVHIKGEAFKTYRGVDWHPNFKIDSEGNVKDHEFVSDIKELSIE